MSHRTSSDVEDGHHTTRYRLWILLYTAHIADYCDTLYFINHIFRQESYYYPQHPSPSPLIPWFCFHKKVQIFYIHQYRKLGHDMVRIFRYALLGVDVGRLGYG